MSKCNTCSGGVHIREIKESQNVTRLAGQVVILDRHFIISLHAPTLYTKWRQLIDKCIFMFNFQMIFCSPCFCNFYPKVFLLPESANKSLFQIQAFSPDSTCYPGKVDRQPSFVLQPKYILLLVFLVYFFLFDHYPS